MFKQNNSILTSSRIATNRLLHTIMFPFVLGMISIICDGLEGHQIRVFQHIPTENLLSQTPFQRTLLDLKQFKHCLSSSKRCLNTSKAQKYAFENRHNKKSSILNTYLIIIEPRCEKTDLPGFPTRHHTNRAVLPQKTARGLKFRI